MDPLAVWRFWFEEGPKDRWFQKSADFDRTIAERFGSWPDAALHGELAGWTSTPRGALAQVLVLDQFPRNLFRGQARMFQYDAAAREAAAALIAAGQDHGLSVDERCFAYLPFEHSEDLHDQDRAIELFTALGNINYLKYAHAHRDVVARFGRFPHRNTALGRVSTPEEQAYLATPGAGF